MRSFGKLVKNELVKIFAQTAYRVLFIIMILLFLLIPLLSKGINWLISFANETDNLETQIEVYEDMVDSEPEGLSKEYYQICLDCIKYFEENNLGSDSWQYKAMFVDYTDFALAEYIYGKLLNGEVTVDDVSKTDFEIYLIDGITEETYGMLRDKYAEQRKDYESLIASADATEYYKKIQSFLVSTISEYEVYLGQLRVEKLHNNSKTIEYQITILENAIEACEISKDIHGVIIENNVNFNSWQYNSAFTSYALAFEISTTSLPLSKDEYVKNSVINESYDSYNAYLKDWEKEIEDKVDAVKILKFSVENDIPTQSMQQSSSKGVFISTINSNIQYMMYFMIVISALIVASEFSSGSARLLFIRPHSRNKILMSKYTALVLMIVALNIVNIVLSFLFTIIFNGVGDIFAWDLKIVDGVVSKSSLFLNILGDVVLANFKLIFMVTFTFMLSTLCKKSALGIVLGIITDMIVSTVAELILIGGKASVIKFIPFTYYQAELFMINDAEVLLADYGTFTVSNLTNSLYSANVAELSVWGAIGSFVFWVGACLAVTLLVFRKQEIKN